MWNSFWETIFCILQSRSSLLAFLAAVLQMHIWSFCTNFHNRNLLLHYKIMLRSGSKYSDPTSIKVYFYKKWKNILFLGDLFQKLSPAMWFRAWILQNLHVDAFIILSQFQLLIDGSDRKKFNIVSKELEKRKT